MKRLWLLPNSSTSALPVNYRLESAQKAVGADARWQNLTVNGFCIRKEDFCNSHGPESETRVFLACS